MAINFNVDPYYDDFDPSKNFHKILFKPGVAVQARELTQSQTILQNQISKFADGIYSQNVPVSGGNVTVNINCDYLKLNRQFNGVDITAENFKNKVIQDSTGTIFAKVIATIEATGTAAEGGDPPTLILSYLSGPKFSDGMQIYPVDGTNYYASSIGTLGGVTSIGSSSVASIAEGVFYIKNGYQTSGTQNDDGTYSKYAIGNFVSVQPQTIVLDKYASVPSYRIGVQITESIVDYVDDSSLLDPAVGATNYQAPGADRFKISLDLTKYPLALGNDDSFIELTRIVDGIIVRQFDETVYSKIDDYFAKRTYDTNGDFVIDDFNVTAVANTSNSALYDLKIGKGTAYIQGYKVESFDDTVITSDRSRDYSSVTNNSVFVDYGNYLYIDSVSGLFDVTRATNVDLHCVPKASIVSTNTTTYNSTLVATAYIRNLDYNNNTSDSNTASYVYKAYLHDINNKTLSGSILSATVTSITMNTAPSGVFSTVANAYYGVIVTINSGDAVGYRGIVTSHNVSTGILQVDPPLGILPTAGDSFTLRFDVTDVESIANTTSGSTTVVAAGNINTQSKVNGVPTNDTQLTNPGYEELVYKIGQKYVKDLSDSSYYTTKVFRNKSFSGSGTISLSVNLPLGLQSALDFEGGTGTLSDDVVKENFTVVVTSTTDTANNGATGTIMDWTEANSSVSISGDKNSLVFTSTKYTTPLTVTVIAKMAVTDADDNTNILRLKTLITGNTSAVSNTGPDGIINSNTFIDLTKGQVYINNGILSTTSSQSLYVSDIKKIVKIIDTLDPAAPPTIDMLSDDTYDITANYKFNNGQKDAYYDHASLTLYPGAPKPKGNILVIFDYYSHSSGDGYFSVESYTNEAYSEIPSYTAKNGIAYSLRDALDFRPTRKNAVSYFDYEYSSAPTGSDAGFYIPQNLTNYLSDYSYYLARKDKLVLTKDKQFQIVKGKSAVNPAWPVEPSGSLLLADITLEPYTTYLPSEAPLGITPNYSLQKTNFRRWTMNDITGLSTRINNIEYYTSLNLLEAKAQTLQVADENGLNRFKNGILVDDFSSVSVAETQNRDWSATVDSIRGELTPPQTVSNYPLQSSLILKTFNRPSDTANTLGYKIHSLGKGTNLFTLPYVSVPVIEQKLATQTVNVNPFSTPKMGGELQLTPQVDNWIDSRKAADVTIIDPTMTILTDSASVNKLTNTEVSSWKGVVGTKVTESYTVNRNQEVFTTVSDPYTIKGEVKNRQQYTNQNGYIYDISMQPYIRPQEILFRASGLQVNTPLKVWFDGERVDQYISNPDTLELTNVTGEFSSDDIIGCYDTVDNEFFPIGTVASVYNYPNSSNTRLYLISNYFSGLGAINATKIVNATFSSAGVFQSYSASGDLPTNAISSVKTSSTISAVGGLFTDANTSSKRVYARKLPKTNAFAKTYGAWTQPDGKGEFDVTLNVNFGKGTTYVQAYSYNRGEIWFDGAKIIDMTVANNTTDTAMTTTITGVTKGSHTIRVRGYDIDSNTNVIAVAFSNKPWTTPGTAKTKGSIQFQTQQLPATLPAGIGTRTTMYKGGLFYGGVTQIGLDPSSSNVENFYVDSQISIISSSVQKGPNNVPVRNYVYGNSTIVGYDATTKIATISPAVSVSVGFNTGLNTSVTSSYALRGDYANYSLALQEGGLSQLSSNELGEFVGVLNIPQNTFRTGERVLRVDNRTDVGNPDTSSTFAEGTFVASSLRTKSQRINFGAGTYSRTKKVKPSKNNNKNVITNNYTYSVINDALSQTFLIDRNTYPNGVFLKSIKLFFRSKPLYTNDSVTLSLLTSLNGYPDGDTLDNSIVTLNANKVQTSENPHYLDGNTYTEFAFSAPVYIEPDTIYAMMLDSPSNDYSLWIAAQNGTAIASTVSDVPPSDPTYVTPTTITKVGSAPYVGNLFESQNAITWVPDPSKSLMFVVDRCEFLTNYNPSIQFIIPNGLPTRKRITTDVQAADSIELVGVTGTDTGEDQPVHKLNMTTTDLVIGGTNIDYSYTATLKDTSGYDTPTSIVPGRFAAPSYTDGYLNDEKGERILLANSNASFIMTASLFSDDPVLSPIISDDGLTLYVVEHIVNNLGVTNTSISITNGGSGYSNNESGNVTVTISAPDLAGGSQAFATANVSDEGIISSIDVTEEGSGYLYPATISIADANTTPGTGASANMASEFSSSGGNALTRYLTKKTTLAQGNDSQDLRMFMTAYRPIGTEIHVFYRVENRYDTETFENYPWQKMTYLNGSDSQYSRSDYDSVFEYELAPGISGVANNQVQYTGTNGTLYTSFNQFQIKIVMTAADKTNVPFLRDIRVIALPSGTGL